LELVLKLKTIFFFLIVCSITACSSPDVDSEVHLSGQTMGTTYNVKFPSNDSVAIDVLDKAIVTRLYEINKLMSTYDPESELSRFNQYRFTESFDVSSETALVLSEAIKLGKFSRGVLDVTVGPLVNLWGFGPTQRPETTPTENNVAEVRQFTGLDKIKLIGNKLSKSHPMVYVDLSTIAKGYAVDELARLVEEAGLTNYLVEIGGEMRVNGKKANDDPWRIAIEKPVTQERAIQRIVSIGDNAVATSGDYRNYFEENGVRYSHLINPNTGKPIQHNTVSVTVVHPSSMVADGLATAFIVMGFEEAKRLAESNDLAILVIRKDGDEYIEYTSSQFDEVVTTY
jgi:thiamine biosynthesis lipoprotein